MDNLKPAAGLGPKFASWSDRLVQNALYYPNEPALVEGDEIVDWATLDSIANQIGQALIDRGIKPNDRVAIAFGPQINAIKAIYGIWRAGGCYVPISGMLPPEGIANQMADCGAKLIISNSAYTASVSQAADQCGVEMILETDAMFERPTETVPATGVINEPDQLASIIYSSGTTGKPKGVIHNHDARVGMVTALMGRQNGEKPSRWLLAIPVSSNASAVVFGMALFSASPVIALPKFDVNALFDIVKEWKPTHGFIVPAMCQAILAHPGKEEAGLSCFDAAITGGAPMPIEMKTEMQRLTGAGLAEVWGLTEGLGSYMPPNEMKARPDSVGRTESGNELRLVSDDGEDVTLTGEGEIVGRSGSMMNGYWNRPELNKEVVWVSPQGIPYLRSGDIGRFDEDGYLYIRGRVKDMLISGGLNVFPADIEAVAAEHEAVLEASVIGVEDERWGETPVAFVRLLPGKEASAPDLLDWLNGRLAKHQRCKDLQIREPSFPLNAMGKVVKAELKTEYLSRQES